MNFIFKIVIITAASISACSVSKGQKSIQFSADVLTGFSKFRSQENLTIGTDPNFIFNSKIYCKPSLFIGFGFNFRFKRYLLGYDYYCQQYNWRNDRRITNNSSGQITDNKLVNIDYYYIKRINFGYDVVNSKKWKSTLILGYAFPAINFWSNFKMGNSTLYNSQGNMLSTGDLYMCRASGYSISLNTGIISKDQKSKISLTLGSEWLSNNTPNRFESHWMKMEKKEWYYSAGLRYSYLLKSWGKK
jgi:hypothetical protein